MDDIDILLGRVRAAPVHSGLAAMDAAVMDVLAARSARNASLPPTTMGLAAFAALTLGVAGSAFPPAPAGAAALAPFGIPAALAPSTLLGDAR